VDHGSLARLQQECSLVDAEETFAEHSGKTSDPPSRSGEKRAVCLADPMQSVPASGYLERITRERSEKNRNTTASYASSGSCLGAAAINAMFVQR